MGFTDVYNETKSLAESFRQTLMNYLVTKRFEKMLQAMQDAASIANTVADSLTLSAHKFKVLSKMSGLVLPSSASVSPNDSQLPGISLSWGGSTINKTVNGEIVKVLPISEITYEPDNIQDFKSGVSGKLNRMGVVIAVPITDPSSPPSDADFHDYKNAYYLPESVNVTPFTNAKYSLGTKEDVEIYIDWRSMQPDIIAETAQLEYIVGQMITYNFGDIGSVTGVSYDVWYNPKVKFSAEGEGGETVHFTINAEIVLYHYKKINNAVLRIGDYTAFTCDNNEGMFMLAPIYTITTGWVRLGSSPVSVP